MADHRRYGAVIDSNTQDRNYLLHSYDIYSFGKENDLELSIKMSR